MDAGESTKLVAVRLVPASHPYRAVEFWFTYYMATARLVRAYPLRGVNSGGQTVFAEIDYVAFSNIVPALVMFGTQQIDQNNVRLWPSGSPSSAKISFITPRTQPGIYMVEVHPMTCPLPCAKTVSFLFEQVASNMPELQGGHMGVLMMLADACDLDLLSKLSLAGKTALDYSAYHCHEAAGKLLRQAQQSKTTTTELEQVEESKRSCKEHAEHITALYDPTKGNFPVTKEEYSEIAYHILLKLSATKAKGHKAADRDRFVLKPKDIVCSEFEHAARGYFKLLNVPENEVYRRSLLGVAAIEEEVDALGDSDVAEQLHYILRQRARQKVCANGVRDKGHEGMVLRDFVEHEHSRTAYLDEAEVVALRLYSTSAFRHINNPLRDQERIDSGRAHPMPVTVMLINRGIKKLRAIDAKEDAAIQSVVLWRGMHSLRHTDRFAEKGGTEVCMMHVSTRGPVEMMCMHLQ
jgi:hypothetical protein